MSTNVAVLAADPLRSAIISPRTLETLRSFADVRLLPDGATLTPEVAGEMLQEAEVCITTWGTPRLEGDVLRHASALRLAAHAAGSVKPIVSPDLWGRGVRVTSASPALAVDVAMTSVALMVLAMKNVFRLRRSIAEGLWRDERTVPIRELYGNTVGIVGASHVGRNVIRLLKDYEVDILLYDPFVTEERARELGTRKCERLEDLLAASDVVSLHAPSVPETNNMLNASNLPLMKDGAVLVNTARGSLVDEEALIAELRRGRIFACIDVTDPEPPAVDSPFRTLDNVLLTPHVAGSVREGRARMGVYAVEEIRRYVSGEPLRFEVTEEMLPHIG